MAIWDQACPTLVRIDYLPRNLNHVYLVPKFSMQENSNLTSLKRATSTIKSVIFSIVTKLEWILGMCLRDPASACVLKCCTQAYKVHSEATSYNYASCTKCRELRRLSGRNIRLIHWLHKELSYADGRGLSCIWNLWWVSTHHRIHKILNSGSLYPVMADEQLILQVSEKTQRAIFSPLVQKHTQTLPNNSIKLTLAAITS